MLSYPVEEAETLLEGKLNGAEQSLENVEEDLDFLREQITVGRSTRLSLNRIANGRRRLRLQSQEYTIGT